MRTRTEDAKGMTGSVAIVGCGALGGVFAGLLSSAGMKVVAVVRSEDERKRIAEGGLRMLENGRETLLRLRVCAELPVQEGPAQEGKEAFDLVLVLVKAFDTEAVAARLAGRIPPETPVLTLQNGLGNAEALAARLKPQQILAGVTTFGALRESSGAVRLTGRGECVIGAWPPGNGSAAELHTRSVAELLSNAGIPSTAAPNVLPVLWKKLAASAVINPLTAILRVPNGELLHRPALNPLIAEIVEEVWQVAARRQIPLPPPPELVEEVERICRGTASNRSSMLRDVEEGRRTEIESINGAVVRLGRERGVLAPANQALASLVQTISARAEGACP